jgi:hypothetical protein
MMSLEEIAPYLTSPYLYAGAAVASGLGIFHTYRYFRRKTLVQEVSIGNYGRIMTKSHLLRTLEEWGFLKYYRNPRPKVLSMHFYTTLDSRIGLPESKGWFEYSYEPIPRAVNEPIQQGPWLNNRTTNAMIEDYAKIKGVPIKQTSLKDSSATWPGRRNAREVQEAVSRASSQLSLRKAIYKRSPGSVSLLEINGAVHSSTSPGAYDFIASTVMSKVRARELVISDLICEPERFKGSDCVNFIENAKTMIESAKGTFQAVDLVEYKEQYATEYDKMDSFLGVLKAAKIMAVVGAVFGDFSNIKSVTQNSKVVVPIMIPVRRAGDKVKVNFEKPNVPLRSLREMCVNGKPVFALMGVPPPPDDPQQIIGEILQQLQSNLNPEFIETCVFLIPNPQPVLFIFVPMDYEKEFLKTAWGSVFDEMGIEPRAYFTPATEAEEREEETEAEAPKTVGVLRW